MRTPNKEQSISGKNRSLSKFCLILSPHCSQNDDFLAPLLLVAWFSASFWQTFAQKFLERHCVFWLCFSLWAQLRHRKLKKNRRKQRKMVRRPVVQKKLPTRWVFLKSQIWSSLWIFAIYKSLKNLFQICSLSGMFNAVQEKLPPPSSTKEKAFKISEVLIIRAENLKFWGNR